jgi:hypothetical protein
VGGRTQGVRGVRGGSQIAVLRIAVMSDAYC